MVANPTMVYRVKSVDMVNIPSVGKANRWSEDAEIWHTNYWGQVNDLGMGSDPIMVFRATSVYMVGIPSAGRVNRWN
jgi:hypothetical protein